MKKGIIITILIILAIILLIFGIPITNNIIAKTEEIKLICTKLPEDTKLIDSISIAGKLERKW
jgi:hypothetical protein